MTGELKKHFGLWGATSIAIVAIIGAGNYYKWCSIRQGQLSMAVLIFQPHTQISYAFPRNF